jgi:2-polyprenyl-6-methoxyphenol hydroxylase-like FAD-dependent oxidoreductase
LIDATDPAEMFGRDGADRKPVDRWGDGRVTLLGDAAHPMTPNLGQGACQAIEDAVVLARCLKEAPDPVSALREYERRRIERTAYVVKRAWQIGAVGRWRNPLACWLRDRIQKVAVPGVAFREHRDWMAREI